MGCSSSTMWNVLCIVLLLGSGVATSADVGGERQLGEKAGVKCIDCGYTPEAPALVGKNDIPRCTDVLCLVQGLLDKKRLIYVERHIDLSGVERAGPLPDITSEVTVMGTCVEGTPCRIDAKGSSQIFVVGLNGYLTLKDLEITGGSCTSGGACTISGSGSNNTEKGGKFVALNVKFTNNTASEYGGALNVESGGRVYIRDCVFEANKASMGGAVFVGSSKHFPSGEDEGVICALNSCASFLNTEFAQNSADFGGAVYVDDARPACKALGGAKFDCLTCSFHDNSAEQDGGAVFVNYHSSGGIGNFQKTRFSQNLAARYGGDVATQQGQYGSRGAQLYAYRVVFSGSTAPKGSAVAVKPFSFSTFTECNFSGGHVDRSVLCEGYCDTFCPLASPLIQNDTAPEYGPRGESCPVAPAPLCHWVPPECRRTASAPSPRPPPPTPSVPPVQSPSLPPTPTPVEAPAFSPSPFPVVETPASSPSPSPVVETPASSHSPSPVVETPSFSPSPSPGVETPSSSPSHSPRFKGVPEPRHRKRHGNGSITGDPHFVGKHGERFDFHGKSGRDYCIVSDEDVHVNMRVFRGLHRRSTFISKIGFLFKGDKVLIEAHANKEAQLFDDQWKIFVNQVELLREQTQQTRTALRVSHLPESVHIRVADDELDVNVTVRPASFGRTGSGANYLNFQINQLKVTSKIHGVLGQTYQETASTYDKISAAKARRVKRSRAASFFVEGSESDYVSSGIMAPDCKYSAFMGLSDRAERKLVEGLPTKESVERCTGFGHSLCLLEGETVVEDEN